MLGRLGLDYDQASSWIFITWFSAAVATVPISLYYRQPIPINWTIPGLVYLGTLAGQFSFGEMVAANLVAGLAIIGLGLLGIGSRILQWVPLPIVMGMFAGSSLDYLTRLVRATVDDAAIAGVTVAGYLLGRLIGNPRLPPVGLAVVLGAGAVMVSRRADPGPLIWGPPTPGCIREGVRGRSPLRRIGCDRRGGHAVRHRRHHLGILGGAGWSGRLRGGRAARAAGVLGQACDDSESTPDHLLGTPPHMSSYSSGARVPSRSAPLRRTTTLSPQCP